MINHVLQWITNRFSLKSSVIQGYCNQCGQCCRNLLLYDGDSVVTNQEQLEKLLSKQPHYKIFKPVYQDPESAAIYFSCRHIGEDNLCQIYTSRPAICDDYPNPNMFLHGARFPEGCSYELRPQHQFASHLQRQKHRIKQK